MPEWLLTFLPSVNATTVVGEAAGHGMRGTKGLTLGHCLCGTKPSHTRGDLLPGGAGR